MKRYAPSTAGRFLRWLICTATKTNNDSRISPINVILSVCIVSLGGQNDQQLIAETGNLSRELHGQRIVRVEPSIPIGSLVARGERLAKFLLIAHVEQCAVGVRPFDDA